MPRTIAVANMKGGVGKTTLSVMLAETLAHKRSRVLLIDLDAQGSSSFALMGEERYEHTVDDQQTISNYFAKRVAPSPPPLSSFIVKAASLISSCASLDLIAAEPGLQSVERNVISEITRFAIGNAFREAPERTTSAWIKKEIASLAKAYDYIIFDCPPGISIFAFAGIQNSGEVLIPTTPDYLSLLAIRSMKERTLHDAMRGRPKKLAPKLHLILNKCRDTSKAPRVYRRRIREYIVSSEWDIALAAFQIPLAVQLERATEADEERQWNTFAEKYNGFYAEQLAALFA